MKSKDLHTWSWRVWRWELSNLKMQASRLTTSLLSGRGWSEYSCAQNISKNHYFDVWHGAKIFQRSWRLLLRKRTVQISALGLKDLSTIAASFGEDGYFKVWKWTSLTEHVTNKHEQCSRVHKLFGDVDSNYVMRDIPKLSPLHQTYGLEVYHSVFNSFSSKNTQWHFFYPAMTAKFCVAEFFGFLLPGNARSGVQSAWRQCVYKPWKRQLLLDYSFAFCYWDTVVLMM